MKTKKELKEAYKQMEFPMGVFQIRNLQDNKVLIDNSTNMPSKWNRHKAQLRFGNHRNKALQKDWNELGEDHFVFEVLSKLKKSDEPNIDYGKELKILQDLVTEELDSKNTY